VAPRPEPYFNRERFLLRCVAWVLFIQFGVWGTVGLTCALVLFERAVKLKLPFGNVCQQTSVRFQESAESSLAILLALLGGGALAASELQRRQKPPEDNNRREP
jgi:hypothetical protein